MHPGMEVKFVRPWLQKRNQHFKLPANSVRILPLFLHKQSLWLNPLEPKWMGPIAINIRIAELILSEKCDATIVFARKTCCNL